MFFVISLWFEIPGVSVSRASCKLPCACLCSACLAVWLAVSHDAGVTVGGVGGGVWPHCTTSLGNEWMNGMQYFGMPSAEGGVTDALGLVQCW